MKKKNGIVFVYLWPPPVEAVETTPNATHNVRKQEEEEKQRGFKKKTLKEKLRE